MVHSTFLIDLRLETSTKLAYWPPLDNYKSDVDDILLFAHSVREAGRMNTYMLVHKRMSIFNVQRFVYNLRSFDECFFYLLLSYIFIVSDNTYT